MRKLLFFHAYWCTPCKRYEREIIDPLEKIVGADRIERIDAWKEPWRAERYKIDKVPTIVLLDEETVYMKRTGGGIDIDRMAEWLKGAVDND